ncbi:MAG: tRNA dihydrouridine synthase DusB, partial [Caulobacterales bacterium]|nr:tRNA dihydrouridine synthase DusB [Caulobacterales bacterium]
LGLRVFRKHLAGYVDAAPIALPEPARRTERARLCRITDPGELHAELTGLLTGDDRRSVRFAA